MKDFHKVSAISWFLGQKISSQPPNLKILREKGPTQGAATCNYIVSDAGQEAA